MEQCQPQPPQTPSTARADGRLRQHAACLRPSPRPAAATPTNDPAPPVAHPLDTIAPVATSVQFGARCTGDLRQILRDPVALARLHSLLYEHQLLVFKGQHDLPASDLAGLCWSFDPLATSVWRDQFSDGCKEYTPNIPP